MFITMLADLTAFICLVFGYFFFWTIHDDFPPVMAPGPGGLWSAGAALLLLIAWVLMLIARHCNVRDRPSLFYLSMFIAAGLSIAGTAALVHAPDASGLVPTSHAYPAIVWMLALWAALHVGVGIIMQIYCIARRLAGHMTARHDIDIRNVVLYWHFAILTVLITVAITAGFPLIA
jgi:cytochrome c oxidase subunit I+III